MKINGTAGLHMLRIKPSLDATKLTLATDDGQVTLTMPTSLAPMADQIGGLVVTSMAFVVVSDDAEEPQALPWVGRES